ncbi:MAG: RNA-binding S4 domain-containing protein [Candidatus Electrothrix sp. YB6]
MHSTATTAAIRGPYIELYKLLKREDVAASGGEAKAMISEGLIRVNGEVETRKRKKIVARDTVEYHGGRITVIFVEEKE